jgi:hypothetical protein
MRPYVFVSLLLLAWLTFAQLAPARSRPVQELNHPAASTRTVALFDFHSNFWVNLHQVLLHEARLSTGKPDRWLQSATPLAAAHMGKQDEADWNAAISFYAAHFLVRREVFDDDLIQINDELAKQQDDGASLDSSGLPSDVVAVLRTSAVVYRKYWWPAHNHSNQDWIASQRPRLGDLGLKLAAAMTKDLQEQWPAAPIRVDVCFYVPEIGNAYTTIPPHTTFSSSAPTLQGLSGFELLFHEASHTFAGTMRDALAAQCGVQHRNCGDLWHTVLFYTSGVELRRLLPAAEEASFTPYAYRNGVYTRGDWPKYQRVLEKDWQVYLDGKTNFQTAIHSMVADLQ